MAVQSDQLRAAHGILGHAIENTDVLLKMLGSMGRREEQRRHR
ncbi:DUF6245 family protein [Streptomyces sp. KR55]